MPYHFDDDVELEDGRSVRVPMYLMDAVRSRTASRISSVRWMTLPSISIALASALATTWGVTRFAMPASK